MISKIRARFSSAHVMAFMALFVVLGGTALAVKKNSVGSKQLKNNAVKTSKIANGAVNSDKLAADSVTGDKVVESSLGKVPSAANADTAGNATTADAATTAASADVADDSDRLEGRALSQVRSSAIGDSDSTFQGLDDTNFEQVGTSASIGIPTGGADLIVNATIDLNHAAGQHGAQCELRSDNVAISQTYTITMANGISSYTMPLTGFADNLPGTGPGDPENVAVFCQGSIADDDVDYIEGDLTVQRVPSGA